MKKILFLGVIAAAVFAFTSCDDIKNAINDAQDAIEEVTKDQAPEYKESDDGLTITVSTRKNGIGAIHEAVFEEVRDTLDQIDTLCVSAQTKLTFPLETAAEVVYDNLMKDSTIANNMTIVYDKKKDAKAISVDQTHSMANLKKPIIVPLFKGIKETYEKSSDIAKDITSILKRFNDVSNQNEH
jgi:hypothetical protein